mmetsp:Transcript_36405/g.109261  ORF Transcript_36405/g.109261 Transcript_36405/m.109261 type:complete len:212 (+) Transcript_36405:125-760(+)
MACAGSTPPFCLWRAVCAAVHHPDREAQCRHSGGGAGVGGAAAPAVHAEQDDSAGVGRRRLVAHRHWLVPGPGHPHSAGAVPGGAHPHRRTARRALHKWGWNDGWSRDQVGQAACASVARAACAEAECTATCGHRRRRHHRRCRWTSSMTHRHLHLRAPWCGAPPCTRRQRLSSTTSEQSHRISPEWSVGTAQPVVAAPRRTQATEPQGLP